jgi:hypothetical protein
VRRVRNVAIALAGAFALWVVVLALFGWLGAECQARKTEERLAKKMRAQVSIGELELGLVTGEIGAEDLRIEREELGLFRLAIDRVDIGRWPLGLALLQGGMGDVRVRGVHVEVTALAVLDFRGGEGPPLQFDSLEIRDADVAMEATGVFPGLARITLHLERAVAGETTLRTPLSWLFALRELDATIELPGGYTARLQYAAGALRLSGTVLGGEPIVLPFEIPVHDPEHELEQLRAMGVALARQLVDEAMRRFLLSE